MRARTETEASRHDYFTGIVLLFAAACLWSLNGALIKLTYRSGLGPPAVTIAFYRSLFAGLFLLPLARGKCHTLTRNAGLKTHRRDSGNPSASTARRRGFFPFHSLFALRPAAKCCVVFFTAMTVCFVLATTKTEAANAIILQYTSTFWVFALSPLVLSETPRRSDLGLLILAMVGIGIVFAGNAGTDLVGLLIALAAGLFYGLETLMIRRMRDSDSAAIIVLNNLGAAALLLLPAWLIGSLVVAPGEWGLLVLLGVVQFGLPYYLYARALEHVPAYQAALITLTEPVLVPVWTYLAVGEKVPVTTVMGGGVILIALVLFLRRAGQSQPA